MSDQIKKENYQDTLSRILENNGRLQESSVRRMLVIYEEIEFFIGDTCILFDRFRLCRRFFGDQVEIDINCINKKYTELYHSFFENNPNINHLTSFDYGEIDFDAYDVVICVAYDEEVVLKVLHDRYTAAGKVEALQVAVFSFSRLMLITRRAFNIIFPPYEKLFSFILELVEEPYELYISANERAWANQWLEEHSIQPDEELFIILDSSSHREKLLRTEVYFEILRQLLTRENVRVLIFDERNIGKEQFYQQWLGYKLMKKIIFAKGLSLRKGMAIISSDYTRLVLGPCTGMLHCASSIYNNFRKTSPDAQVPVLITYTGPWHAAAWWGNAPLVDCLLLQPAGNGGELTVLADLSAEARDHYDDRLACTAYTSEMLIGFLNNKLDTVSIMI